MSNRRIRLSLSTPGNFGPRQQSRETSKDAMDHQLGVSPRRSRRKEMDDQLGVARGRELMDSELGIARGRELIDQLMSEDARPSETSGDGETQ